MCIRDSLIYTDGNGCSSTVQSASLSDPTPPATPTISTNGPTTFCEGGNVQLTSSASAGNSWSTTATGTSITVTTSGTYGVTVTEMGCSATSSPVTITVNPNPTAPTITADGGVTEVCAGDSVVLTSSYSSANEWSNLETSQSITVFTTGDYDVTYTDANGCSATSPITSVVVNALPSVDAGADQEVCDGESVTLSGLSLIHI